MKNTRVQKMVTIAMFAAVALVSRYFAFPITSAFSSLKIDLSDISVLISMFLFGLTIGATTAFLRSVLHPLVTGFSPDNLTGDIASFLSTTVFTLPVYYFFSVKKQHKGRNEFLGAITGTIVLTVFMSIVNYSVIIPLYLMFLGLSAAQMLGMSLTSYVLIGIVPFNLVKGLIVGAVFLVLHAQLPPWSS